MFNDIAPTYDIANRILSGGVDKSWRRKAVNIAYDNLEGSKIKKIVDVACGTGDMIEFWKKEASKRGVEIESIDGVDPSFEMLKVAKEKCKNVAFHEGFATELPFEDGSVDIVSIVYGIRNVVDREDALKEFHRVLKKGGLLVILEFTKEEQKSILQKCASFYNNKILPTIGGMISGSYEAYKYLPDSIDSFLTANMLKTEMESVGFIPIFVKGYSANISTTFIAKKESE